MVVKVVLDNREQNIDRTFDYLVPPELEGAVTVGTRVAVPFGLHNNKVFGIVTEIGEKSFFGRLKALKEVVGHEPVCEPWVMKLCTWVKEKYFCSLYQAIRLVMPPGLSKGVKEKSCTFVSLAVGRDEALGLAEQLRTKSAVAQARVIEALLMADSLPAAKLVRDNKGSYDAIRSLEKRGIVAKSTQQLVRQAYDEKKYEKTAAYTPTAEQKRVIDYLYSCIEENRHDEILLRGVTGSGKTEVFLQAIEKVINGGKNAIMLVPEISLTPQMVQRFVGRFGNRVAVIHSALSDGERYDQWNKIKNGEVQVVVGARSAVFAPFTDIGIIILDEEHENSYKSETTPRYHAIEVAEKRAADENCVLLLASATPSVTEYYRAREGELKLFEMTKRYNESRLPEVKIVDMRGELFDAKNMSPISRHLQSEIRKNLDCGQKTILFLNRRGYSTFVSCRQCGEVLNCPDCSIALTYHKRRDLLTCHYCGYTQKNVTECPSCGSKYIKYFGTGTQKIEEELGRLFPDARVLRMDTDTTSHKGGHELILDRFARGEADILLGTQMVTKGLDFHDVTLVGVLAADSALAVDDFRANERSFSLFTQVCGRAGRGDIAGRAVIQTYQPFNSTIRFAKEQDYTAFYESEILQRKRLNYPPFCDIIFIMATGEAEDRVEVLINDIAAEIKSYSRTHGEISGIIGPVPAPIAKIKSNYRYRMLVKCTDCNAVMPLLKKIYGEYSGGKNNVFLTIDINPVNMY